MRTRAEDLAEFIGVGREQRHVEFKVGGPLAPTGDDNDRLLFAKVVRAIIAMANLGNGGRVILGVAERVGQLVPEGISAEEADTWRYDRLADLLRGYADPPVEFDIGRCELDGKTFLVIEVAEFADLPILCRKGLAFRPKGERDQVLLREGALYVRGKAKIESVEVSSVAEMREVIELATDKASRRLLARVGSLAPTAGPPQPSDDQLFDRQRRSLA
jgi:predicted HTH transcriptional regulator